MGGTSGSEKDAETRVLEIAIYTDKGDKGEQRHRLPKTESKSGLGRVKREFNVEGRLQLFRHNEKLPSGDRKYLRERLGAEL